MIKDLFPFTGLINLNASINNHNCIVMRKFLIIIILFLTPAFLSAQQLPAGYDAISNMQQHLWMNKNLISANAAFEGIKGTPLLFEEFRTGNFYFNNKTCITGKMINYNCFTDDVLFSDENMTYVANSQDIDYFTITGNEEDVILLFKQVFLSSEKKRIFMQVLYQGQSVLFKRYRKEFLEADYNKPYGQNRQVDEYNDYYEYYVKPDGREITLLKPKKSSVMDIFSDKPDLIGNYIIKEKISLKDEADLIRLVKYYDSL
jgi:hypothetical protein